MQIKYLIIIFVSLFYLKGYTLNKVTEFSQNIANNNNNRQQFQAYRPVSLDTKNALISSEEESNGLFFSPLPLWAERRLHLFKTRPIHEEKYSNYANDANLISRNSNNNNNNDIHCKKLHALKLIDNSNNSSMHSVIAKDTRPAKRKPNFEKMVFVENSKSAPFITNEGLRIKVQNFTDNFLVGKKPSVYFIEGGKSIISKLTNTNKMPELITFSVVPIIGDLKNIDLSEIIATDKEVKKYIHSPKNYIFVGDDLEEERNEEDQFADFIPRWQRKQNSAKKTYVYIEDKEKHPSVDNSLFPKSSKNFLVINGGEDTALIEYDGVLSVDEKLKDELHELSKVEFLEDLLDQDSSVKKHLLNYNTTSTSDSEDHKDNGHGHKKHVEDRMKGRQNFRSTMKRFFLKKLPDDTKETFSNPNPGILNYLKKGTRLKDKNNNIRIHRQITLANWPEISHKEKTGVKSTLNDTNENLKFINATREDILLHSLEQQFPRNMDFGGTVSPEISATRKPSFCETLRVCDSTTKTNYLPLVAKIFMQEASAKTENNPMFFILEKFHRFEPRVFGNQKCSKCELMGNRSEIQPTFKPMHGCH